MEVLVETDDGEQPTGRKRNSLLRRATGRYVAFVDDDDLVSDRYVDSILSAILHSEPDCCSLTGILLMDGVQSGIFEHSLAFDRWFEPAPGRYNRCPNHLNPVKRELALQAGFPDDLYFAEDRAYSERLRPLLKTQETIPNPIYLYDCRTVKA